MLCFLFPKCYIVLCTALTTPKKNACVCVLTWLDVLVVYFPAVVLFKQRSKNLRSDLTILLQRHVGSHHLIIWV